ncbi:MAG: outer membrane protein assembly factor BamD [Phycisphaerales bacterium]|nr:outer membrane protein assembly factor BamD [Phycisphaerales bacterium]
MERIFQILISSLLILPSIGMAQDTEAYHERLEFDPATGKWKELPPPIPGTEGGDLALARSMLAKGEYKNARKAFKKWFEQYPESPYWPEALFYAAETEVSAEDVKPRSGDVMQAYEWLETLLEGWRGHELADRALHKEFIIAEMLLFKERKQKIWGGVLWLSAKEEALDILNKIIDLWAPGTPLAERALRFKADYHYQNGEFEEAEMAYARLMRDFPRGQYHRFAMLRSGQSALARFPGIQFDEADLLEAEVYLRDFHDRYPEESAEKSVPQLLKGITDRRAEKEYSIGQYYERTDAIDAAAYYYRWIIENYPETTWSAQSQDRLIALGGLEEEAQDELDLDLEDLEETDVMAEPTAMMPADEN